MVGSRPAKRPCQHQNGTGRARATYVEVHGEKVAEEQGQVLDELLVLGVAGRIRVLQVHLDRDDVGDGAQRLGEHLDQLLVVVGDLAGARRLQAADLGQALEGDVPELRDREEATPQRVDQRRLEDVAEGDPVAETQQRLQRRVDEAGLGGRVEDLGAELEDLGELGAHGRLQVPRLRRRHLLGRVVEHLLRQQSQDYHVVFADRKARVAGRDDLVDEGGPVVRPFLLEHRYEDQVELV